ncbi:phenylpropionate dioxygenase-like ring-hydroxylating dioxygenase large terminal subunit [Sinorhizobium meliloti]
MSTLTTTIDLEQIHILGDHAIRALPELTEVTTKWLINKDPVGGLLDYTIEDLTHVWTETNDRDRQIVEEIAFGIHSPAYESGPYSTEDEGGVMQFRGVVFEIHAGASSGRAENSCL